MTKDQLIKVLYPNVPSRALCDYLGINTSQLYNTVYKLGVKKNPRIRYLDNKRNAIANRAKTQFKKGHEPHNKGGKMPPHVYEKAAPTMFKPGQKPMNTREPNATSIRDNSGRAYHYTKIKDGVWKLTHRVIWEEVHGEIPKGHIVRFKDGNTMNLSILNLECIPMRKNMIKNTIQRYPKDLQLVMKLRSKLNKTINNGKKPNERS